MCLLDNVRLIENDLAPPTASTFEHSITKLASYEHVILEKSSVIVLGGITGSQENSSRLLWRDSLRSQGQESEPVSVGHHSVEYGQSRAAGYPKIG